MSNAALRILTALVGAPLVIGGLYLGGWVFGLLLLGAALVAQLELYRLMEAGGAHPAKAVGLGLGVLLALHPLVPATLPAAVAVLVVFLVTIPFQRTEQTPLANVAATVFGAIYPTVLLAFLLHLRLARGPRVDGLDAFLLTLLAFLLIWATDTFAYYVGRAVGRRPLAPSVSPKKTWEGSAGGVAGALLVACVFKTFTLDYLAWGHVAALAVMASVIGQLGDLAESKLKRSVGVKDSGTILPGHGGLLDRLDSIIVVAPLVFLYLAYVARLFY